MDKNFRFHHLFYDKQISNELQDVCMISRDGDYMFNKELRLGQVQAYKSYKHDWWKTSL